MAAVTFSIAGYQNLRDRVRAIRSRRKRIA